MLPRYYAFSLFFFFFLSLFSLPSSAVERVVVDKIGDSARGAIFSARRGADLLMAGVTYATPSRHDAMSHTNDDARHWHIRHRR